MSVFVIMGIIGVQIWTIGMVLGLKSRINVVLKKIEHDVRILDRRTR